MPEEPVAVETTQQSVRPAESEPVVQKQVVSTTPAKEEARKDESEQFLPEIPSHAQYLIVGGGTAAMSAFKAIRAGDPTAKVGQFCLVREIE